MWECVAAGLPIVVNEDIVGGKHLVVPGVTGELAPPDRFREVMEEVLAERDSYRPREHFESEWDTVAHDRGLPRLLRADGLGAELMFLVGGPAFSGTTLLAHLLNQGDLVCLDEPDFHDPEQSHRGIPLLRALFPDRSFPDPPGRPLDPEETFRFIERCDRAIPDRRLGVKTCDTVFLDLVPDLPPRGISGDRDRARRP